MNNSEKAKINLESYGRPMLYWVGKHPLDKVNYFPTQLINKVNTENEIENPTYGELKDNWNNLLFHGDNKEILSTLLSNGFANKIDLIYIDPPFDSGANYIKKIKLKGNNKYKENGNIENYSLLEQVQYEDIWKNDEYLQFMYERLLLLRELLSDKGSIYLHCDPHKNHHLRMLLDEVFGENNFRNEIIWHYTSGNAPEKDFSKKHDVIYRYVKTNDFIFNRILKNLSDFSKTKYNKIDENGLKYKIVNGYKKYLKDEIPIDDTWEIAIENVMSNTNMDYPTQKPEALLERIIEASSNEDSIVLDCFMGSGTTIAVAEKLGRKWIGADINKGAVQTTIKRLQDIYKDKQENKLSLLHYKVNNYDFREESDLRGIIENKYSIEKTNSAYFDGKIGDSNVIYVPLNKPLTKLDIEEIQNRIKDLDDDSDIIIICNGREIEIDSLIYEYNKLRKGSNEKKILIRDIQEEGIIMSEKPEYEVSFERNSNKIKVKIDNYISNEVLGRLKLSNNLFQEEITDFRQMIDYILIDKNYNGKIFNIDISDGTDKKDLIKGVYEIESDGKIALKIVDVLGEETLIVEN